MVTTRREVLSKLFAPATLAVFPGCSLSRTERSGSKTEEDILSEQTENSMKIDTPAPKDCNPIDPPKPAQTSQDLSIKSYPSLPSNLSQEDASSFSKVYEDSFQYNSFLLDNDDIDRLSIQNLQSSTPIDHGDGFVLSVTGELDASLGDTLLDDGFGAWYYVSEAVALRREAGGNVIGSEPPSFESATVVACGSDD